MSRDGNRRDRRTAAVVLSALGILLVVVAAVRLTSDADDDGQGADALPAVELVGAGDRTVSTEELIGQPLVMNFWYAACPPCANELRDFAAVSAEYGDEVRFVGVNAIDTVEEMTDFAGERGVTYELFQDRIAELQSQVRLASFPTTLFIDSNGRIVERTGVLDEASLTAEIEELLAAESEI